MTATSFYEHVSAAMAAPPQQRHQQLLRLHDQALRSYQTVLNRLTAEQCQGRFTFDPDRRGKLTHPDE
jgi:hypothetical protein